MRSECSCFEGINNFNPLIPQFLKSERLVGGFCAFEKLESGKHHIQFVHPSLNIKEVDCFGLVY